MGINNSNPPNSENLKILKDITEQLQTIVELVTDKIEGDHFKVIEVDKDHTSDSNQGS